MQPHQTAASAAGSICCACTHTAQYTAWQCMTTFLYIKRSHSPKAGHGNTQWTKQVAWLWHHSGLHTGSLPCMPPVMSILLFCRAGHTASTVLQRWQANQDTTRRSPKDSPGTACTVTVKRATGQKGQQSRIAPQEPAGHTAHINSFKPRSIVSHDKQLCLLAASYTLQIAAAAAHHVTSTLTTKQRALCQCNAPRESQLRGPSRSYTKQAQRQHDTPQLQTAAGLGGESGFSCRV